MEDLMITKLSPEEDLYKALSPIKEKRISASKEVEERVDLIFKADQDPNQASKIHTLTNL